MQDWEALDGQHLVALLFLAQAAALHLKASGGIVNITDIHTERPMPDYVAHNVAKAGLRGLHLMRWRICPGGAGERGGGWGRSRGRTTARSHQPSASASPAGAARPRRWGLGKSPRWLYLICDAHFVTGHTRSMSMVVAALHW